MESRHTKLHGRHAAEGLRHWMQSTGQTHCSFWAFQCSALASGADSMGVGGSCIISCNCQNSYCIFCELHSSVRAHKAKVERGPLLAEGICVQPLAACSRPTSSSCSNANYSFSFLFFRLILPSLVIFLHSHASSADALRTCSHSDLHCHGRAPGSILSKTFPSVVKRVITHGATRWRHCHAEALAYSQPSPSHPPCGGAFIKPTFY